VIPTEYTFVKLKLRMFFGNLSDFSKRVKSLLKFIKDLNVESVSGFLAIILLGIGCLHN
jgi:ABC-type transporter lipoprotein component MlaA